MHNIYIIISEQSQNNLRKKMDALMQKYMTEFEQYTAKPSKKLAISIRASLLEISKLCAVQRTQFLQESKNMPTKPRTKKLVPLTQEPPFILTESESKKPVVSEPPPVVVEQPKEPPPVVQTDTPKDNLKVPRVRAPSKRKTQ